MTERTKNPFDYSLEELDRELIARGARIPDKEKFRFNSTGHFPLRDNVMREVKKVYASPPPRNSDLDEVSTLDLTGTISFKTRSNIPFTRGPWSENLLDFYKIKPDQVKKNFAGVAAICSHQSLLESKQDCFFLSNHPYGETFNLCKHEPFHLQPVVEGELYTGFLVASDLIVTAAHCVNDENLPDLRFVFGYQMVEETKAVTQFPGAAIYQGIKIIERVNHQDGENWALVKLDRSVSGQPIVTLSKENLFQDQKVYIIGHPLGLPLKYAGGISIKDAAGNTSFMADLDVYSGNSGAPIFDLKSHHVIGMVRQNENGDFRWTADGWLSVINPSGKYTGCTRISSLNKYL